MAVKGKIKEAKYFLDKIERAGRREDFIPNLSAFLCAAKSIPDYLLEDYNVKYGLDISLSQRLDKRIFQKVATERKNPNAQAFIKGYNERFDELMKNKIAKLLLIKRNIKVHRADLPLQKNVSASIIENVDKHYTTSNTTVRWLFDDYKEAEVIEVCKEFLRLMKEFVKNLTSKYG